MGNKKRAFVLAAIGLTVVSVPSFANPVYSTEVWGYTMTWPSGFPWMWDVDPVAAEGRVYDDMSFDLGNGWQGSGYADTGTQAIGLYASRQPGWNSTETYGTLVDTYTFVNGNNPVPGSLIPGLFATLTYNGDFSRVTPLGETPSGEMLLGLYLGGWTGGSHAYSSDPGSWSGSVTLPFFAYNDTPITGQLDMMLFLSGGDTVANLQTLAGNYLNAASLTFGSTDPSVSLRVTSEGGYLQMPSSVPEPSTIALLLSGVATLSFVAKARRNAV